MAYLKSLFLSSFFLCSLSFFGQTSLIGKVTNSKNEPILNATVFLDTLKVNTTINAIGFFQISVPNETQTISIHAPDFGYLTAEFKQQKRLNFVFTEPKEENKMAAANTNAINVKDDRNKATYTNIYEYIAGKFAGVKVVNGNEIIIRGGSSWELSNDPLFVVDGAITSNIDNILPTDVDQIVILKGVDTSIYGSQGANGVIEITTR